MSVLIYVPRIRSTYDGAAVPSKLRTHYGTQEMINDRNASKKFLFSYAGQLTVPRWCVCVNRFFAELVVEFLHSSTDNISRWIF